MIVNSVPLSNTVESPSWSPRRHDRPPIQHSTLLFLSWQTCSFDSPLYYLQDARFSVMAPDRAGRGPIAPHHGCLATRLHVDGGVRLLRCCERFACLLLTASDPFGTLALRTSCHLQIPRCRFHNLGLSFREPLLCNVPSFYAAWHHRSPSQWAKVPPCDLIGDWSRRFRRDFRDGQCTGAL